MNLDVVESQIRGLRRAADDLDAEFDRLIQPGTKLPSTPDDKDRFTASVLVMPILRALAAELALKAISFKRSGSFERWHDLRDLYDDLDNDTRNLIEQKAIGYQKTKAHRVDPVPVTLTSHRTDFVNWRYAGENKPLNANPNDLDDAVEILMAVYGDIKRK
ncbi:MAG: hypothetical protein OXE96_16330 [Gemmatimonadetes bacterium]|nr:hypothetical protein [Gemmatimonadota bacterium]